VIAPRKLAAVANAKRLKLKRDKLSFHSLRHTFAMALKRVPTCDVETRERLLGHSVGGMAQRYGGGYEAEAQDVQLLLKRASIIEKMRFDGMPDAASKSLMEA
jgi:integrase